jgi:diguanylate cyclase (GGDEF)-like protein
MGTDTLGRLSLDQRSQSRLRLVPSETPQSRPERIPLAGRVYLAAVCAAALGASVPLLLRLGPHTHGWPTFAVLAAAGAVVQLYRVTGLRRQSYDVASGFTLAGVFLLPVELVALLALAQLVTAPRINRTWYIVCFNVSNWVLGLLGSWVAMRGTAGLFAAVLPSGAARALGYLAAIVANSLLQGLLLTFALHLAAGRPLLTVGLFDWTGRYVELILGFVAVALAEFWRHDPWLAPFALVPLALVQRSMHVPVLEEEARLDAKTGLFNARHFRAALAGEHARAERNDRPLSILVADLDLLREVNNTHGHLAGDAVLAGVADVFRMTLRRGDVPARFGGEEFAVLLPDTGLEEALIIAERLRGAVAATIFRAPATGEGIRATLSAGVAEREAGVDPDALLHAADLAVYRAKAAGRDRVVAA